MAQKEIDRANEEFWNEACGTTMAKRTGTVGNYGEFDKKYFTRYPFLLDYLRWVVMCDNPPALVLEIGTGYGTVGQWLDNFSNYTGMDIAEGPVKILDERGLKHFRGNILKCSTEDPVYDGIVSIGCLHHTGNTPLALENLYYMLKKGGKALVMLYSGEDYWEANDANLEGELAPHTDYYTFDEVHGLFSAWTSVEVKAENNDHDLYIKAVK